MDLKPHTRSVAWIVEQVIVQQTKYNAKKLGVDDVNFDLMPGDALAVIVIAGAKWATSARCAEALNV